LLFLSCTFAAGDVLVFTDKNFDEKAKEHDLLLVKYYAPWCGHCKQIAPKFEKAAAELKNADPPVALAEVDCDAHKDFCQKVGVNGYPTLKIYRKGVFSGDYDGGREADDMVKYMKAQSGPSSKELKSSEEFEKFINVDDYSIVGFFKEDSKLKDSFLKVADTERTNYRFAYTSDGKVMENDIVSFQPKCMYNIFEKPYVRYDGNFDTDKIKKFIKFEKHGLCGHRTESTSDHFRMPVVVAYYGVDYKKNAKITNYYRNRLMKVAVDYKTKDISFAVSNKDDFSSEIENFGLTDKAKNSFMNDQPFILILNDKGQKFVMEKNFSIDNVKEFVDDFLAGKLPVHVKSEDIPEKNEGPVIVAVGKTFHDIVGQDKDVLIEFYAPWCGHCKNLAPIYEELATKMKDEDNIVIAKMDATANEVPPNYSVSGFPTIYWAPKGQKDSPKLYKGGRTVDDFIKYIAEEATEELKGWDRSGKAKSKSEL
uniref:Protein disulfide-isomerase n=1 Tax=Soboliphyme baturini TaxID=241478 RepID=A0A183IPG3_9BILA